MKLTKKEIEEIVNSDGELIGTDNIPKNGADLESQANNTTDYNAKIGHQPYRYDMLGRFGFTLLPFFEGIEENEPNDLLNELARFLYDRYMEVLEHYYRNPQKLKSDFRKKSKLRFDDDESNKIDYDNAKKILQIVKKHMGESLKELDEKIKFELSENLFIEDKLLDKKEKRDDVDNVEKKNNDILDAKVKKIAGLINKLDIKNRKKIKNLLETD